MMSPQGPNYSDVLLACYREAGLPEPDRFESVNGALTFYFKTASLWSHPPEMLYRAHAIASQADGRQSVTLDQWLEVHWRSEPKCRAWLRHHGYGLDDTEPV